MPPPLTGNAIAHNQALIAVLTNVSGMMNTRLSRCQIASAYSHLREQTS